MRFNVLGATGLSVSELGYGCWGLGGVTNDNCAYGPTDDQESVRALRLAYEMGVNFYDTAPLYGDGHSEVLLNQALGSQRKDIIISTKVGYCNYQSDQDFSERYIRQSCHDSLTRLGTDYIDIYHLHDVDPALMESHQCMEVLHDLKKEGKIRFLGFSTKRDKDCLALLDTQAFDATLVNFNLLDQRPLSNGIFDKCIEMGVGVIAKTPLCFGFLADETIDIDALHKCDIRNRSSRRQLERWQWGGDLYRQVAQKELSAGLLNMALRFCTSNPSISVTLSGMLTIKEVKQNVDLINLNSLEDRLQKICQEIYNANQFYAA